jgi:hypothetical protein
MLKLIYYTKGETVKRKNNCLFFVLNNFFSNSMNFQFTSECECNYEKHSIIVHNTSLRLKLTVETGI